MKSHNNFIENRHFKLDDLRTAIKLLDKDSFMINIDLKDAYFSIPIHADHKKYLRFHFNDQLYQFNFLPFGLCTAPYVFTKIMRPVTAFLRRQGHVLVNYLDDFIFINSNPDVLNEQCDYAIDLLQNLGFRVNFNKSNLIPSQHCKFLGLILDSKEYCIAVPIEKRLEIYNKIIVMKNSKICKIWELAHLIGKLISICPGIAYGTIHTKAFERKKMLALKSRMIILKRLCLFLRVYKKISTGGSLILWNRLTKFMFFILN